MFAFAYRPYVAIIGDVRDSRLLENRGAVQEQLKSVLTKINRLYAEDISAKFMITLGDEFQGLLGAGKNAIQIVEYIQREMYPVEIRFGLGIGEITTEINAEMAIGADGPGYYCARNAIEYLKDNEGRKRNVVCDVRIEIEGDYRQEERLLNTVLSLMTVIRREQTDRQREIIKAFEECDGSQKDCAGYLNISQPSVQRNLNAGNYYEYRSAMDTITKILEEIK